MWLWLRGSGWISTPGVSRGTTNMPFVHITKRMSATRPALVNHFSPLITHSSPSRTAWVLNRFGSRPALRLGHRVGGEHLLVEQRLEPPLLLLLGAVGGEHLHVPGVGRGGAEHLRGAEP